LKTRKLPDNAPTPTTTVLVLFQGSGAPPENKDRSLSGKKLGRNRSILRSGRDISRTKQWRRTLCCGPAVHLGFRSGWSIHWWRAPWRHDPVYAKRLLPL